MKLPPAVLLSVFMLATCDLLAQTTEPTDSSSIRAAYFDLGYNIPLKNGRIGLTLVTRRNWLVAAHLYTPGGKEAPQKPADFQHSPITRTGGNSTGGGLINPINFFKPNTSFSNEKSSNLGPSREDPNKIYKISSLTAGRIFLLHNDKLQLRTEAGVAFMKIDEAVDFQFIPASMETDPNTKIKTTITEGYTFDRVEYHKTGGCVRLGLQYPISRFLGLNAGMEGIFTTDDQVWGFGVGLLFGVLR